MSTEPTLLNSTGDTSPSSLDFSLKSLNTHQVPCSWPVPALTHLEHFLAYLPPSQTEISLTLCSTSNFFPHSQCLHISRHFM